MPTQARHSFTKASFLALAITTAGAVQAQTKEEGRKPLGKEGEWCESAADCAPGLTCSVNFCESTRRPPPEQPVRKPRTTAVPAAKSSGPPCQSSVGGGAGVFFGSAERRIPAASAAVLRWNGLGDSTPVNMMGKRIQLRDFYYRGTVQGSYVVPNDGAVGSITVDGTALTIADGSLASGCIKTIELGTIQVQFSPSQPYPILTLTAEQIKKLP